MMAQSVLANGVINITANTRQLDGALNNARANIRSFQAMASSLTGFSLGGVAARPHNSSYVQALTDWRGRMPQRANYQNAAAHANAMGAWKSAPEF